MTLGYRMRVDLRSRTEGPSFYTGDFDSEDIKSISKLAYSDRPWVAADVGANVGFWTVPLAQLAKRRGGCVYAFEPVLSNFNKLRENIDHNGVADAAILHNFGLSDGARTAQISLREDFDNGSKTGNAALVIDKDDLRFHCTEVHLRTLDEALPRESLDFIKLDIEGHEDSFLTGAEKTLQRCLPIIYMEINDDYFFRRKLDPTELFTRWMAKSGYASAIAHFRRGGGLQWLPAPLSSRRRGLDNVLLIPQSRIGTALERLNS